MIPIPRKSDDQQASNGMDDTTSLSEIDVEIVVEHVGQNHAEQDPTVK